MQRILIVEDEEPISNLIKINLITEGYMCKCVFNGIDAANIAASHVDVMKKAYELGKEL